MSFSTSPLELVEKNSGECRGKPLGEIDIKRKVINIRFIMEQRLSKTSKMSFAPRRRRRTGFGSGGGFAGAIAAAGVAAAVAARGAKKV